ncbi:homeodomain-containing protein [Naegleria gruberi]|uniref:Homeodomain-containing protein n=1 Tax=Naegleria gruberi TaxID=5762 RepID=D2VHA0_NAEGR|nr:homeodomain-containing protein [Naegleria gruberi]EFC43852.1 homeodomain-containing protein [Naegleria gruberi]|eukprot:XP_002676596.1 homeodomain-containing protein [Naegleria gruberi strain NEG-M]
MPQNLIPFNQLPTLSTNNEAITTRLPPIQTLTQYCCPPKPVPFVPLFPPSHSNNSQAITHVSRNISPPIKTSFVFHQVNPTNLFPSSTTPVPTFQPSKYNAMYENPPNQKKTTQSCIPNHLTFVNMDLSTNKKLKPTSVGCSASIENTFQVSNVGSSSCDFRTPLIVNNSRVQSNSISNTSTSTVHTIQAPLIDTSIRRKNKKQAQESSSNSAIVMENPQEEEEANPFRTTSNRNLPKQAVSIMKEWLFSHKENPYPTEEEKIQIQNQTGLSQKRINYWFINARRRLLPNSENKKRPTSNNFPDTKRLRKNSIASSSSNASMFSSYTTVSSSASSSTVVSSSEEDSLSQSSDERVKVVDSWVVDCLLTLREENKP